MNFTYENQGAISYLVYQLDSTDTIDTLSYGMLTNNKIPHIASIQLLQKNEDRFFKYNISSKVSVSQFFVGTVSRKRLLGVFSSVANALLAAEDYMVEPQSFIYDLDYIFVDVSNNSADMICLPLMNLAQQDVDLSALFKNIMFNTQFDQSEDISYVAEIINLLNSMQTFSLTKFRDKVDELYLGRKAENKTVTPSAPATAPGAPAVATVASRNLDNNPLRSSNPSSYSAPQNAGFQGGNPPQAPNMNANPASMGGSPMQTPANPMRNPVPPMNPQTTPKNGGFQVPGGGSIPGQNPAYPNPNQANPQGMYGNQPAPTPAAGKAGKKKDKKSKAPAEPEVLLGEDGKPLPPLPKKTVGKVLKGIFIIDPEEKALKKEYAAARKRQKESQKNGVQPARVVPGAPKTPFATPGMPNPGPAPLQQTPGQGPTGFANNSYGQNMGQNQAGSFGNQQPYQGQAQPAYQTPANFPGQNNFQNPPGYPSPVQAAPGPLSQPVGQPSFQMAAAMPAGQSFGETTVLGGGSVGGETTVLGNSTPDAPQQTIPFLIRRNNNEKIMLDKDIFRMGKERSYVDYLIADNSAVSRSHATITREQGAYFIEDTNSLNHTYVNGQMIPSNQKTKLEHGTTFMLANEAFEFRLY